MERIIPESIQQTKTKRQDHKLVSTHSSEKRS